MGICVRSWRGVNELGVFLCVCVEHIGGFLLLR